MVLDKFGYEKPFTLGEKLAEVEGRDAGNLLHPAMTDFVKYNAEYGPPPMLRVTDPYPGLGLKSSASASLGATPAFPVSGPSVPECGHRPTDPKSNPFPGLSHEMATYNYNRTNAIMAGARPGC